MAHKFYYVDNNGEMEIEKNNFIKKMSRKNYCLNRAGILSSNSFLVIYYINNLEILFRTGMTEDIVKKRGNIGMFGELENIIKTKEEIEKKTGVKFKEVSK